jgi:hypothetical protein
VRSQLHTLSGFSSRYRSPASWRGAGVEELGKCTTLDGRDLAHVEPHCKQVTHHLHLRGQVLARVFLELRARCGQHGPILVVLAARNSLPSSSNFVARSAATRTWFQRNIDLYILYSRCAVLLYGSLARRRRNRSYVGEAGRRQVKCGVVASLDELHAPRPPSLC